MAAASITLKEFFEGRRRKLYLRQYTHLKTRAGEERIKLDLTMPLLNESAQGIPIPISDAFMPMAKDESAIKRSNLNIEFKGMTIEFFSDDTSRTPWTGKDGIASATSATLCRFALISEGVGEKRTLDLQFVCYLPANVALLEWARPHLHGSFFGEATYSQSEMEFTPEEPLEADEEEETAASEPGEPEAVSVGVADASDF